MRNIIYATIAGLLSSTSVTSLHAQDVSFEMDEIVVTARKRDEDIQDVPISITAITRRTLDRLNASRVRDLEHAIPNLTINGPPSNADTVITIRGVSSEASNAGFESSLSVYVDGIYQGRPVAFNQDLVNVESMQVLRGPQGIFFGRNSTAGAIVINNMVPDEEFRAELGLEYSSFDTFRANGTISGQLGSDKLFGSISAFHVKSDGYMENAFDGSTVNNENAQGLNAMIRALPSDNLELIFRADLMRDRRDFLFGEQTVASVVAGVTPGRFTTNLDGDLDEDRDIGGVSLTANLGVFGDFELTSITAWRFADTVNKGDIDASPVRALNQTFKEDQEQFSQELRIASPEGERFNYVAGLYYFHEKVDTDRQFDVDEQLLSLLGVPPLPFLQIPPPATNVFLEGIGAVKTTTAAAYVHSNVQFSDKFSGNFGARLSNERKELVFAQTAPDPLLNVFNFVDFSDTGKITKTDLSPTIGLAYDATEDLRFYTQVTRGFKGGGWNLGIQTTTSNLGTAESISFDAETITNYEFGMRSQWSDGRVMLNVTAFYMDYADLQVSQFDPIAGIGRFTNAGSATITGGELEFRLRPVSIVSISGGLGYLAKAEFDEFKNADGPGVDFDGNRLPNAPRWTGNIAVDFDVPIRSGASFIARAGYRFRSKTFFDERNDPVRSEDAYGLIDAHIGYVSEDDRWEITVWGKNLTDKEYVTVNSPSFFGGIQSNFGIGRTYGVRLKVKM